MTRLIALAFAMSFASSAQAMPHAPIHQTDGMVIPARQGCGLGHQLLDGVCVRNSTVRAIVRKCRAKKMRVVNGRCQPIGQPRPPVQPPRPTTSSGVYT